MEIKLSDHFSYKNIFKQTYSPILMMVFISLYSIVDGFFISNFGSEDGFAGVNLIFPVIMVIGGIGFMYGTGGSALASMQLGQNNKDEANKTFTMIVKFTLYTGILFSIGGFFLIKPIANAMGRITNGSTQGMVEEAIIYGRILTLGQVAFMLQNLFQSFLIVDEKPKLGFLFTLLAGITNMILDALFIWILKMGVVGAAIATIIGYIVGGIGPFIYFITHKDGNICLVKTKINFKTIWKCCANGSSEFVNNISSSVVSMVFNIQLLKYFGQDGVSAYGIIMYVSFIFVSMFIGYSIGMAPIIGYNYGAKNHKELKSVLKKSLIIIGLTCLAMFVFSFACANPLSNIFTETESSLYILTVKALKIYSINFLMCGFSIYLSSFFTALNNGLISAIISFCRTLVFQILFVLLLPIIMGQDGIWWSIVGSEIASITMSISFLLAKRKKYGY